MKLECMQGFVLLLSQDTTWIWQQCIVSRRLTQTLELAIQVTLCWNVLPTSGWDTLQKRWLNCKHLK